MKKNQQRGRDRQRGREKNGERYVRALWNSEVENFTATDRDERKRERKRGREQFSL